MDYAAESVKMHSKYQGKLSITSDVSLKTKDDLSIAYTPGVAEPCRIIAQNPEKARELTIKGRTVAVISDGSAVLGLGNIGGLAGLPVMEGKAILFKEFAGVDAFPIVLNTQDPHEIIDAIVAISPTFGGINLEDIKAPQCFMIEEILQEKLDIPVFHDDQHGTAIVVVAGLKNAAKVVKKDFSALKVVINGAGAAGLATMWLLRSAGVKDIVIMDSRGIISKDCVDSNPYKCRAAQATNPRGLQGDLSSALKGADVFIGVSKPGLLNKELIQSMAKDSIIFAMANPTPEIMPEEAHAAGVAVVGTGRSDFPNQINNVLAFPGLFKGLLASGAKKVTEEMKLAAADAIASFVEHPTAENILPSPLEKGVAEKVAAAVMRLA